MSERTPPLAFEQDPSRHLEDLLVRQAALNLARQGIVAAEQKAEERLRAFSPARSLRALVSSDGRKKRRDELGEAQEAVQKIASGLRKLDAVELLLLKCLDESLENYLREYDAEYINGLASSRFPHDWRRIIDRFDQAAEELQNIFKSLAKVFTGLPPYELCVERPDSHQLLWEAANIARRMDDEVRFINKIADVQRINAGPMTTTLLRQPEAGWAPTVASLLSLTTVEAVTAVNGLARAAQTTLAQIRAAIASEGQLAMTAKSSQIPSYHALVWASRREAAPLKLELNRLEAVLAETEALIDAGRLHVWHPTRTFVEKAPAKVGSEPPAAPVPASPPPPPPPKVVAAPAPAPRPGLSLSRRPGAGKPAVAQEPVSPPDRSPSDHAEEQPQEPAALTQSEIDHLEAERQRLERELQEAQSALHDRETFVNASQAKLDQKSQNQLVREQTLRLREAELRGIEKRLQQSGSSGA